MLPYNATIDPEHAVTLIRGGAITALLFLILISASVAAQDGPRVVASIAPLHSLVAAIMDGRGEPHLLLRGAESPHSFSLRPSDARALNQAHLVFWIGPELEQPLERILPTLAARRSITMLTLPGIERLPQTGVHDHSEPVEATKSHESSAHPVDPHVWLSPGNAIVMADAIADALIAADPQGSAHYQHNVAALKQRLSALDQRLRAQLRGLDGHYAVFHNAYQYFEHRYGLHPVGGITTHAERRPGASHLNWLRKQLRDNEVRCLFSEPQFDRRLVDTLSEGLPIKHAVLDPLGANIKPGPDAYFDTMQQLADSLSGCLAGASNP